MIFSGSDPVEAYGAKTLYADEQIGRFVVGTSYLLLDDGVETVEEGFLERLPKLKILEMAESVKHVGVSKEFAKKLRSVLICGVYDSYAEEFAKQHRLNFLHSDIELARAGSHDKLGIDIITLQIFSDCVKLYQDNRCPGSSAGNCGGGSVSTDLSWAMFSAADAQDRIAAITWGTCREQVRNSDVLRKFIETTRLRLASVKHSKLVLEY